MEKINTTLVRHYVENYIGADLKAQEKNIEYAKKELDKAQKRYDGFVVARDSAKTTHDSLLTLLNIMESQ